MIKDSSNKVTYEFNKRYISADTDEELEGVLCEEYGIYWLHGSNIGFCINSNDKFEIYEKHDRVISSTDITFNYYSIKKMIDSLTKMLEDLNNQCRGCKYYKFSHGNSNSVIGYPCLDCSRRCRDMYEEDNIKHISPDKIVPGIDIVPKNIGYIDF